MYVCVDVCVRKRKSGSVSYGVFIIVVGCGHSNPSKILNEAFCISHSAMLLEKL